MFRPPAEEQVKTAYLKEYISALPNYLADDVRDRCLVGLRILNKMRKFRIQWWGLVSEPVNSWSEITKVVQSNGKFGLSDHLELHLDHACCNRGENTKGRFLDALSAIKGVFLS